VRQDVAIALAACLTQKLIATDFEVSGRQEIQVVLNSTTSTVFTTTFTLTCIGTNWAITNVYTNSGVRECIAMVDGRSYSADWYAGGGSFGGLVMDRPSDRLEAAPEFVRGLVGAFLTFKDRPGSVSNAPVGFLFPRHPALYCYGSEVLWSSEAPMLPERIRFHLDHGLCKKVSSEAISYFFRSGYRDRSLFRRWQETQKPGAEYSVSAWRNWGGLTFPQRATLTHIHFDDSGGGQSFPRMHLISVTNVQRPTSATLVPTLLPGSSVQEVAGGICYLYTSPDGRFLPVGQAKSVGTVLTKPATPGWVTALSWIWSLPWRQFLCIAAVFVLALGAAVVVVLGWRMFASRR
jgi:hypothetical protein